MMTVTSFDRLYLKDVIARVKAAHPGVAVKDAWVWRFSSSKYEFHFGRFYWFGSAENATQARAAGWEAYLQREGE